MQPDLETTGVPAGAAGPIEGDLLPVGTAENGPDAPEINSTPGHCAASYPLAGIAARINEAHDRASASARTAVEAAVEAGHLLIQAKNEVGHGGWLSWLKANTSVSKRTAQVYMKLARELAESAVTAHLTLDEALKLLASPEANPKRPVAHRSAASARRPKAEVLPPVTKPPGVSPNLLMADVLVDRIRQDVKAAERRGIDVANLVLSPPVPLLGPSVSDAQACVPPFPMSADREAETSHRPSAVTDEIDTINAAEDTGTAGDTDDLEVHYGPLTGREWVALGECVETHDLRRDPDDHRPGEPQYRPEFLRLVEFHHVPFAQLRDRVMAEDAGRPWLRRAGDADHAGGVQ